MVTVRIQSYFKISGRTDETLNITETRAHRVMETCIKQYEMSGYKVFNISEDNDGIKGFDALLVDEDLTPTEYHVYTSTL